MCAAYQSSQPDPTYQEAMHLSLQTPLLGTTTVTLYLLEEAFEALQARFEERA